MKIAALVNAHSNSMVLNDTLDSVAGFMTKDILVMMDGAAYWKEKKGIKFKLEPPELPVPQIEGCYHGRSKSPYRNFTLGIKTLYETFPDSDWYCQIEYDCLVASEDFKEDLELANSNIWMFGNDVRRANYSIPLVENVIKETIPECQVILGCCVFFRREFLKLLSDLDFFRKFLWITNPFQETMPGFEEQGAYDVAEVVYPTLAAHFGGEVGELARFNFDIGWSGNAERYPMRFRPDIHEDFPEASILHPVKKYDSPIREYHREIRKRLGISSIFQGIK